VKTLGDSFKEKKMFKAHKYNHLNRDLLLTLIWTMIFLKIFDFWPAVISRMYRSMYVCIIIQNV